MEIVEIINSLFTNPIVLVPFLFIVATIATALVIAVWQGRDITLWPPRISGKGIIIPPHNSCGIQIINVFPLVNGDFEVVGSYKEELPNGYYASLFNITKNNGQSEYWPKTGNNGPNKITFSNNDKSWRCKVGSLANNSTIQVFLVRSGGGKKLADYHLHVGYGCKTWCGIKDIPDDTY